MPITGPTGTTKKLKKGDGLYGVQHLPSKAPDKSKTWAVVNLATGDIAGRWHPNEASAKDQQKALYAKLGSKARFQMGERAAIVKPIRFAEFSGELLWIEALPAKTWHTRMFGEVVVTKDKIDRMLRNFKGNVRGQEVATDFDHGLDRAKGNRASGWIRDAKVENDTLYVGIEPTATAKEEILNKEWKYFSLEWEDYWQHPETQELHQDVITGGALTNNPVAKGLMPINFSELYDEKEGGKMPEDKPDVTPKDEHAAEEHAPPGGEPDPQTNPDDSFPDRHVTLPADSDKTDEEGRPATDKKDTEEEVNELDKKLREKLGLAEDADIIKAVDDMKERLGPLDELAKKFSEKKAFADAYPEQAAELDRLRKERMSNDSIKFSEKFGEKKLADNKSLSRLALDKIQSMHYKFSEGTANAEDFDDLMNTLTDEKSLVEFSERGSERSEPIQMRETDNPRMAFSERVKEVMESDKLDWDAALAVAAEKHPDLAQAYLKNTVRA